VGLSFTDDPYLLRGLARCVRCDRPMACGTMDGRRGYGCRTCPAGPVTSARALESRVLVEAARRTAIDAIAPGCRASALRQLLVTVVVGPGVDDVRLHWRI
jgi:hypothetical protein